MKYIAFILGLTSTIPGFAGGHCHYLFGKIGGKIIVQGEVVYSYPSGIRSIGGPNGPIEFLPAIYADGNLVSRIDIAVRNHLPREEFQNIFGTSAHNFRYGLEKYQRDHLIIQALANGHDLILGKDSRNFAEKKRDSFNDYFSDLSREIGCRIIPIACAS